MSLTLKSKGQANYIIKKKTPREADELLSLTRHVEQYYKIKYSGETLAQYGELLREAILYKRIEIPDCIKDEVKNDQHGKCTHCQELLTETCELDHIKRVADGGTNNKENIQYLCKSCHNDKTESEEPANEIPDHSKWESAMSGDVLEGYMAADKPQNLIFGDGFQCEHAIDNIRSRANGIIEPDWGFPKISILDTIEPFVELENMDGVQVFCRRRPRKY
jgi:hypothetical protein